MNNNKSKPKLNGKTMKRLFSYVTSTYKIHFIIVIVCILFSALAGVGGSLFLQIVIDDYITPLLKVSNPVFSGLLKAILVMAGIYSIGVVATFLYNRLMVTIGQGVQKKIRDEMYSHMQTLSIKYFDTHSHGDIMSRYTNDIDTLRQMLSQSIPQMFSSAITIVSVFLAMIYVSWHLTVIVIIMVVVMLFITRKITGRSSEFFIKQQSSMGKTNGFIEEMINGQNVVKVFCHEEDSKEQFDLLNEELCDNATKANNYANILMPIMSNLGNLLYVLVAIVGGVLALSGIGGLTLGAIASFLQLSKTFSMPIGQISQQLNAVIMALAGAQRIFELMDEESEEDEGYVTLVNAKYEGDILCETKNRTGIWAWKHPHEDGTVTYTKLTGDVQFFDVDFGYNEEKTVLHNVSLDAHSGEKLAFVGATGAGKTTITNLINRFYDIQDGKIRYDDININKIRKSDLRRSLGVVLQDTNLFTGTIMENIKYGKLDATDEEIYAAARLANADGFISMMPKGYGTILSGDGSGLSQGQRQLLSIARAAVANPPVMILDEATSSIDTRTEAIVQRGMDSLMQGRTVFVIAHRLSTVKNADEIMVLDEGRIIECGNHEKLISEKGKYYQLYTGAFELE
ncbi:ABC transporter ATP-binding protein/permease [Clostridium estertheticum]|uniref:ABC transporter ATP-binding protein n=1 Tax=Clostridium estertheticum TaxID=238834 RepID=UPI001CF33538|nr:ABC transporter ATP-binding protein [Clostridium estertheticum]MCB2307626.1 ABC transporter ATP-binding protein/permease [Clostridium estertheticum]MCB2346751.1 ABC transporter ATP-binding protein/permease [Clostridium estertheticum]MCB2351116.1 ABC transporter ATP-binding protein/permease [Clostridium estertheticum]WAG46669.1 ABC transporter ATP-binding protein/permease [Clostridium estertheticum]